MALSDYTAPPQRNEGDGTLISDLTTAYGQLEGVTKSVQALENAEPIEVPAAYTDEKALAATAAAFKAEEKARALAIQALQESIAGQIQAISGLDATQTEAIQAAQAALAEDDGVLQGLLAVQQQQQTALGGKVDTTDARLTDARPPVAHKHLYADITDAPVVLALMQALAASHGVGWGDSTTNGLDQLGFLPQLSVKTGFPFYNRGVGGETSSQIRTRLEAEASATLRTLMSIIWAGRNNSQDVATVLADIAAMVAKVGKYLVLSVLNASNEPTGSTAYASIKSINDQLAARYGERYVDVRQALLDAYNPALAQDVTDRANGVIPTSLRRAVAGVPDVIHLNGTGNGVVATALAAKFSLLLSPATQQLLTMQTALAMLINPVLRGTATVMGDDAAAAAPALLELRAANGNRTYVGPGGDSLRSTATPFYVEGDNGITIRAQGVDIMQLLSAGIFLKRQLVGADFGGGIILREGAAPSTKAYGGQPFVEGGLLKFKGPDGRVGTVNITY
jgi:lysophospholipase L1-like esterase